MLQPTSVSRRAARALLLGSLLLTSSPAAPGTTSPEASSGSAGSARAPDVVVARIRIEAPHPRTFVLRATLPVPPRTWLGTEAATPFQVRDPEGRLSPAQLEIVTRYPRPADGADVVELLATVRRPPGTAPGTPLTYAVLAAPAARERFGAEPGVHPLFERGLFLEVRDVFGHLYRADLLHDARERSDDLRILRDGPAAHQVRTHEILVPVERVAGDRGTLDHHVGVHSYVTLWQGAQVVSLDLRIYNGGSGVDPRDPLDDPNTKLYFDRLSLRLLPGWNVLSAFRDPFLGPDETQGGWRFATLLAPLPAGKLHMMPEQANMTRRLVLYRDGHLGAARAIAEEQTLGFCSDGTSAGGQRLISWWNPRTGRYFAQRQPLPRIDHLDLGHMRIRLEENFESLRDTVAQGTADPWPFPVFSPALGWAHPYGHGIGYAHGGDEINFFSGADVAFLASRAGYRTFQLVHRMYNARHATTLYDADGEPTRLESWLRPGGPTGQWNPTWVWIKPVLWLGDPFGFKQAPTFQTEAVTAMGKEPDYEDALLAFQHIDDQHLVRYTRPLKVLAWLGNDALAKDDLLMQAEAVRLTYSNYPNSPHGDGIAIGMYLVARFVEQFPHQGARVHRGTGWEIDTVASAYAVATPQWRAALETWCDGIVELMEKAQDRCTGVLGSNPNLDQFGGQYRARQSISESILENALWALRSTVYGDRRPRMSERLGNILIDSGYAMISDLYWDTRQGRPHFFAAHGPHDDHTPPFCNHVPPDGYLGHENYQGWPTLAYAYRLTRDAAFLTKALEMAGGDVANVPNFGGGYLDNVAPMLALFQELGL